MSGIFYSIRFRMTILVLLILMPSAWLFVHSILDYREALLQKAYAEAQSLARLAAIRHESYADGACKLLTGISMMEEIRSMDEVRSSELLKHIKEKSGFYGHIYLFSLEGSVVASSGSFQEKDNSFASQWIENALKEKSIVEVDCFVNRVDGNAFLNFAAPVSGKDGAINGGLFASVPLDKVMNKKEELLALHGASLDLADRNGFVLSSYHNPKPEDGQAADKKTRENVYDSEMMSIIRGKGDHGYFIFSGDSGTRIYAFAAIKNKNERYAWLIAGIDEKAVYAVSIPPIIRNICLGVAVVALSVVSAWLFAGLYVVRFIGLLARAAKEISKGNFYARTGINYKYGEIGFLAMTFDVMTDTIRKRDEDLRASEAKYRMLMELAADGIFTADAHGNYLEANRSGCDMFGYEADELRKLNIKDMISPDDLSARPIMYSVLETGERVVSERRIVRRDGSCIDVEISARKLPDGRLMSIVRDVTERKKAEKELRRNEAMLRAIVDNAPVYISITDLSGKVIMVNRKCMSGNDQDSTVPVGVCFFEVLPESIAAEMVRKDLENIASDIPLNREEAVFGRDGQLYTYFVIKFPVYIEGEDNPFGLCSISTDITERKRAERLLEHERRRFKGILDEMNDGVCIISANYDIDYVNPALKSVFGSYDAKKCHQYFACSEQGCSGCNLGEIIKGATSSTRVWKCASKGRIFDVFSTPLKNDDDSVSKLTIMHEITDRIFAEKALFESEANYRLLFETACEAIILLDNAERSVVDANPAASAMYGYERQAFTGLSESDLNAENQTPLSGGLECPLFIPVAFHKRKNGSVFPVEISTGHIAERGIVVAFVRDISERLEMEARNNTLQEQLVQSQKMETVGRLAGGVAHDFNNILVVIMGYSEMLLQEPAACDSTVLDYIGEIRKACEKAQSITGQLLAFGRKQNLEKETVDLGRVANDFLKMMERLIGEDISVAVESEDSLWHVEADASQIEQVLMNLAVNARDAMPKGGEIFIRTCNQRVTTQNRFFYGNLEPGDYVFLEFSDTGCGMDDETAKHVFDPFFTTKEKGKGTGLGLSTVHGVVKQHGGEIYLKTRKGEGTVFTVCLPRYDGVLKDIRSASLKRSGGSGGSGTVIVVEDEAALRKLLCDVISKKGYDVVEARNATEALKAGIERRGRIDLLVSDVVMPEMNGPEVAEKLLELCPGMKVLFISGYEGEALEMHGIMDETILLRKPFPMDELITRVQEILDEGT